jgi:hypothetical protein
MTDAEQAIADLDAALASDGEWIELWRETGQQRVPFKVRCRDFVRGYAAQELVGGIAQTDSKIVMSPTEIVRAGWPGAPNSSAMSTNQDRRVPRRGDAVVIAGRKRAVEAAGGIYLSGELVRIEMRVLG